MTRHLRTLTPLALLAALLLAACDASAPDAPRPPASSDLPPLSSGQQDAAVQVFQEVEALFDLGFAGLPTKAGSWREALAAKVDTTTYTGVWDDGNAKGYLLQIQYREPQGVPVWTTRFQHARPVDHDQDAGTPEVDAVETITLTFLTGAAMEAFVEGVEQGTNTYLLGTSNDAEAAFTDPSIDVWRVSQVYAPVEGSAIVTYANAQLRETVAVRDPIITLNANGTGTVRDGGPDGSARTRYYGEDFQVFDGGTFSGTLDRTLQSYGDASDGALISRTDYAADGTWRQTRQRGGDGVVYRENSEG